MGCSKRKSKIFTRDTVRELRLDFGKEFLFIQIELLDSVLFWQITKTKNLTSTFWRIRNQKKRLNGYAGLRVYDA